MHHACIYAFVQSICITRARLVRWAREVYLFYHGLLYIALPKTPAAAPGAATRHAGPVREIVLSYSKVSVLSDLHSYGIDRCAQRALEILIIMWQHAGLNIAIQQFPAQYESRAAKQRSGHSAKMFRSIKGAQWPWMAAVLL